MDLSIKLLKNVVKLLILSVCISVPAYAKKARTTNIQSQSSILATSYLVKDLDTGEIITQKNTEEIRSIASITKLMTAIVVLDAKQDLSENIVYKRPSGLRSRLPNGITLKRSEIMLLALMSSDNVAATLLAENYPGGVDAAIGAMNIKAHQLGMLNSHFTDPTGLLSDNVSTAEDLTKLVDAAYKHDVIREYSTKSAERVSVTGKKKPYFVDFHTTNSLVTTNAGIALSKTGWIQKSGGCLVMIVKNQGQRLAVILLNSRNTHTRIRDGLLLTEYNNVRNQRNFR